MENVVIHFAILACADWLSVRSLVLHHVLNYCLAQLQYN